MEAPSASHQVLGLALLAAAVSLWMLRPVKGRWEKESWEAGLGSGMAIGGAVMAMLGLLLSHQEQPKSPRQSTPNESSDQKNLWKQESLDTGALPSHQESPRTPCIGERSLSSDAETPKSQDVTCPCMRHTTTELPVSCESWECYFPYVDEKPMANPIMNPIPKMISAIIPLILPVRLPERISMIAVTNIPILAGIASNGTNDPRQSAQVAAMSPVGVFDSCTTSPQELQNLATPTTSFPHFWQYMVLSSCFSSTNAYVEARQK